MSCYFVAQITVNDEAEYRQYLDTVDAVFAKFNGRYLAVDPNPVVLEGSWNHGRIVLIEFPNEHDLYLWYRSQEYQEVLKHRLMAAACDTLMVKGINS